MSTKIYPSSGGDSARGSRKGPVDEAGKSPRPSPRQRKMSRQSSFDGEGKLTRQGSSKKGAFFEGNDLDGYDITDHSGTQSARDKKGKRSSRSRKSGKKRVSFSQPLVDPRPEKVPDYLDMTADYSINEEEYKKWQANNDGGVYTDEEALIPRRMKHRRRYGRGSWRRYIPFGQYIPQLPSLW
jgi:hypothetical protein